MAAFIIGRKIKNILDCTKSEIQRIHILKKLNFAKVLKLACATSIVAGMTASNVYAGCTKQITVPLQAKNASRLVKSENQLTGLTLVITTQLDALGKRIDCQFTYLAVPKNRQEAQFKSGSADLLFLATRTANRDKQGILVPFFQVRAMVIGNSNFYNQALTLKKIAEDKTIHVVIVRGFDYGDEYNTLIQKLEKEKRVSFEADVTSVVKMMAMNKHYVTVMTPMLIDNALQNDEAFKELRHQIRYDIVDELSWIDMGVYVSTVSLGKHDQAYLMHQLGLFSKNEQIWQNYLQAYSSDIIRLGIRQLPANAAAN